MAGIKISLLGPFSVSLNNDQVTQFESDAARILLAYLALNPGMDFRREFLADLFWPEKSRDVAMHALRQTLLRLRKAIDDDKQPIPYIIVTRQTIAFNSDAAFELDVNQFLDLTNQTERHPHKRIERCEICIQKLKNAVSLVKGELLQGVHYDSFVFEDWLSQQREQINQRTINVLYTLTHHAEMKNDFETARKYAKQQITMEPWREEAHRQLMRILAKSGQRSAAMKHFVTCKKMIKEELSFDVEPETEKLHKRIYAGEFDKPIIFPSLPVYFTQFIGRAHDFNQIFEQINHPDCGLLTILGMGGMGKTRLAVQIANLIGSAYQNGVAFVSTEWISSVDLLVPAIAHAVQLQFSADRNPLTQLQDFLRNKEILLILDGFEHVENGAQFIAQHLQIAPDLMLVVTSRQRLNIPGECVYALEGLPYESSGSKFSSEALTVADAILLFQTCAQRIQKDFSPTAEELEAIKTICECVGGIPLAIELAASWISAYPCTEIADQIQQNLDLLSDSMLGYPEKQNSMRAVFDASWKLLSESEQEVLQQLSHFRGSFNREAAETISGANPKILAALASRSLIGPERSSSGIGNSHRYEFLELIRRFTEEKVSEKIKNETLTAIHRYYMNFLLEKEPELMTNLQPKTLAAINKEIRNIEIAWKFVLNHPNEQLHRAGSVLFTFFNERCRYQEGLKWFSIPLELQNHPGIWVFFTACKSWFEFLSENQQTGRANLEESITLAKRYHLKKEEAFSLIYLGAALFKLGAYPEAKQTCLNGFNQAVEINENQIQINAVIFLSQITYAMGDFSEAKEWSMKALKSCEQNIGPVKVLADSLRQLGNIAYSQNQYQEAQQYYEEALKHAQTIGNLTGVSAAINNLGSVAVRLGKYTQARQFIEQGLEIKQQIGDDWGIVLALNNLGVMADDEGDYETARNYYAEALTLGTKLGSKSRIGRIYHNLASTLIHTGQFEEAQENLLEALSIRENINDREGTCRSLETFSLYHFLQGNKEQALEFANKSLEIARQLGNRAILAYALLNLGNAMYMREEYSKAYDLYQEAYTLRQDMGETHLAIEMRAHMAFMQFLLKNSQTAVELINEVLSYLEENDLTGTEDLILIYVICHRILLTQHDPRADQILKRAHTELLQRASRLKKNNLREAFLQRIPSHRMIMEAWEQSVNS